VTSFKRNKKGTRIFVFIPAFGGHTFPADVEGFSSFRWGDIFTFVASEFLAIISGCLKPKYKTIA
jgi:hypothetical protein